MSIYYFDTSALIKHYVTETGALWVNSILDSEPFPHVFISQLTIVEVVCAFARRVRERVLHPDAHAVLLSAFDYDVLHRYNVINVMQITIETARLLAFKHPLRAYDAVQLASACLIRRYLPDNGQIHFTFSSADDRLNKAAHAEGLTVENPLDYAE